MENYKPSQEEINKAEEMMTSEQKEMSEQRVAEEMFLIKLERGKSDDVDIIKNNFNFPESFLQSQRVKDAAEVGVNQRFHYFLDDMENVDRAIEDVNKIKEMFGLSEEIVRLAAENGLFYQLLRRDDEIMSNFNFLNGDGDDLMERIVKITNVFNLSKEVVRSAAQEGFLSYLLIEDFDGNNDQEDNDFWRYALKIKNGFNLSNEFIQVATNKAIEFYNIKFKETENYGFLDRIGKVKKAFELP